MKEGERVRQAKQGVHGAAQGVGNRVPGQETWLRGAGGGLLLHGTFDHVICDVIVQSEMWTNTDFISYLHSSWWIPDFEALNSNLKADGGNFYGYNLQYHYFDISRICLVMIWTFWRLIETIYYPFHETSIQIKEAIRTTTSTGDTLALRRPETNNRFIWTPKVLYRNLFFKVRNT